MSNSSAKRTGRSSVHYLAVWILLFLILGGGAAAFVSLSVTPKTRVTGIVRIAASQENPLVEEPTAIDKQKYELYANSQAFMMTAEPTLRAVANDLENHDLELLKNRKASTSPRPGLPRIEKALEQAVNDGTIEAHHLENTELLYMSMVSHHPDEAKLIVDTFLHRFVEEYHMRANRKATQELRELKVAREDLDRTIREQRKMTRVKQDRFGARDEDSPEGTEQLKATLSKESAELQKEKLALETQIERLQVSVAEPPSPNDPRISPMQRRQYVQSDPQIQALARRMAEINIEMLEAKANDPNESTTIEKKLNLLARQQEDRTKALEQEFATLVAGEHEAEIRQVRAELERVMAYEARLHEQMEELSPSQVGRKDLDLRDRQAQLEMLTETYDKLTRRIHKLQIERDSSKPRIELLFPATVEGPVDRRWFLTGITSAGAAVVSLLLTILYAGLFGYRHQSGY